MVEQKDQLDAVFSSLRDSTRRDILRRVSEQDMSIGEIAENYQLSFAAVAKHLEVLQRANLITKSRKGKEQIISLVPKTLAVADEYFEDYKKLWEARLDSLDSYLHSVNKKGK
jgi:DNA-binding transcriptional ArsR family regulator